MNARIAGDLTLRKTDYTVVSLFSGAMGLDVGIESSGRFRLLAAVEQDRACCATIRLNRDAGSISPDLLVIEDDIRNVDAADLMRRLGLAAGELDLLVGGPPCQSFSTAGRRGSTQDPRGELLWDFLRFVRVFQPRFFLMENVRGLLSAAIKHRPIAQRPDRGGAALAETEKPGSVVALFADDLRTITPSYHLDCFEVNAVNYGAPQLRERALFFGNRFGRELDFPDPTHGGPEQREAGLDDLLESKTALKPWATLRDAIGSAIDPGDVIMDFSPRKKAFLCKVPAGSNWRSLPVEEQRLSMGKAYHAKGGRSGWWRRLSYDLPCPTLVAMPNHASTALCHPGEVRALSLAEYAKIQEFPVGWRFAGSATQQYAQVGNAVPVRLGKIAGEIVADALDELRSGDGMSRHRPSQSFRVIYIQSHVRTRQWFKGGEALVWKQGNAEAQPSYGAPVTGRRMKAMVAS